MDELDAEFAERIRASWEEADARLVGEPTDPDPDEDGGGWAEDEDDNGG